jgi:hypothetical protein
MWVGFTPLLWLWALLDRGCLPGGLAVPSFLSNCSYSYGTEFFGALREQERRWSQLAHLPAQVHDERAPMEWAGPVSELGLSPLPNGTASLLQINVGFGTTGTRSLFNKDSKTAASPQAAIIFSALTTRRTTTCRTISTRWPCA